MTRHFTFHHKKSGWWAAFSLSGGATIEEALDKLVNEERRGSKRDRWELQSIADYPKRY